jgi:hypothetical protein
MYYTGVYSWALKRHGPPAVVLAALPHETGLGAGVREVELEKRD